MTPGLYPLAPPPRVLGLATAVPERRYHQTEVLSHFARHFPLYRQSRVQDLFLNAGIEWRHFALEPESFSPASTADDLHATFRTHSAPLAEQAARGALSRAGLLPRDIDFVVVATCTGYICPGLSAYLAASLGLPRSVQRADLVGMGCSGAMPAIQRAHDFARAYPGRRALVVMVEVSSACWFVDDTLETVVGNAICADGAAALVLGVGEGRGPVIERFAATLDPSHLASVGFEFRQGRNRIILDARLRHDAGPLVQQAVLSLLGDDGEEIDHWVIHSGGRRVLDGIQASLGFTGDELCASRTVLRDHGNMSSPTVMFVLERALATARPGQTGVMVALGPGLAAETALLRWESNGSAHGSGQ